MIARRQSTKDWVLQKDFSETSHLPVVRFRSWSLKLDLQKLTSAKVIWGKSPLIRLCWQRREISRTLLHIKVYTTSPRDSIWQTYPTLHLTFHMMNGVAMNCEPASPFPFCPFVTILAKYWKEMGEQKRRPQNAPTILAAPTPLTLALLLFFWKSRSHKRSTWFPMTGCSIRTKQAQREADIPSYESTLLTLCAMQYKTHCTFPASLNTFKIRCLPLQTYSLQWLKIFRGNVKFLAHWCLFDEGRKGICMSPVPLSTQRSCWNNPVTYANWSDGNNWQKASITATSVALGRQIQCTVATQRLEKDLKEQFETWTYNRIKCPLVVIPKLILQFCVAHRNTKSIVKHP